MTLYYIWNRLLFGPSVLSVFKTKLGPLCVREWIGMCRNQ